MLKITSCETKGYIATNLIKEYFILTKPGIIIGNLLATVGGFLLASRGVIDALLFTATVSGIALVIASGCVFNNYMDRRIDALMSRTKNRSLVVGSISLRSALSFGSFLGGMGFLVLYFGTNTTTTLLALIGFIFYVFIYGYFKRKSSYSTIVGSIPGAIPLVVGYCAVTNAFDIGATILFLTMAVWQMPHFYAISIFRHNDYKNAGLPVLSVAKGIGKTKRHILFFVFLYGLMILALVVSGTVGYVFAAVMLLLTCYWAWRGVNGFKTLNSVRWARKMFGFSLIVLLSFSLMLSLDMLLH